MILYPSYLPAQCPPQDAFSPSNEQFFRLIKGDNVTELDFIPVGRQGDRRTDNNLCEMMGLSLFSDKNDLMNKMNLPKFRKFKNISVGLLDTKSGKIKQTFNKYHYTRRHYINIKPESYFQLLTGGENE